MANLQITFRSISDSPALHRHITKHFQRLSRIYPRIILCHVVLDIDHKHKHKGKLFSAKIDTTIPGHEFVSRKESENLYTAIHDCFHAIEKILTKNGRKHTVNRNALRHFAATNNLGLASSAL